MSNNETIEVSFNGIPYVFPASMSDESIVKELGIGWKDYNYNRAVVDGQASLWITPKTGQKG